MTATDSWAVPYVPVPLHAPLTTTQLSGRACIYCTTTTQPLEYAGWVHTTTAPTPGSLTLSCPVSACPPCREQHPLGHTP